MLWIFPVTLGFLLILTLLLKLIGRKNFVAKPPCVDIIVALYSMGPWIYGWLYGALGLGIAISAQFIFLEFFHITDNWLKRSQNTLSINKIIESFYGSWRNRLGLWLTVPVVPGFFLIRLAQNIFYPMLVLFLGFKRFSQAEYISVSRQKVSNLVGADLVWCLYCDWMTGLWSLGTAMLNQVESFWCPLKFPDSQKCAKCSKYPGPFETSQWTPAETTPEEMKKVLFLIHKRTP